MCVLISSKFVDFSGHIEQENVLFFFILNGNNPVSSMASVSVRSTVFFKGYLDSFIFLDVRALLLVFLVHSSCSFSFLITALISVNMKELIIPALLR